MKMRPVSVFFCLFPLVQHTALGKTGGLFNLYELKSAAKHPMPRAVSCPYFICGLPKENISIMDIFYLYVQSDLFGVFRLTSALMGFLLLR